LAIWRSLAGWESGAARQRRLYRETGSWEPLIADMVQRLYKALDAPAAKRQPAAPAAVKAPSHV
jgi:hypothetical protein